MRAQRATEVRHTHTHARTQVVSPNCTVQQINLYFLCAFIFIICRNTVRKVYVMRVFTMFMCMLSLALLCGSAAMVCSICQHLFLQWQHTQYKHARRTVHTINCVYELIMKKMEKNWYLLKLESKILCVSVCV